MKSIGDRYTFAVFAQKVISENGPVEFMSLVLRGDLSNSWDVVVAADWASANKSQAIGSIIEAIKAIYGEQALRSVARIAVLDPENTSVRQYTAELNQGEILVQNPIDEFFGVPAQEVVTAGSLPADQEPRFSYRHVYA